MNIGKREILKLYKRCMIAAKKCPTSDYRKMMIEYVKYKNKTAEGDDRIKSLYQGLEEVESMEKYHNAVKMQKEENEKANREFLNT